MHRLIKYMIILLLVSCNPVRNNNREIITVSIPPFKYFVESIGGSDFDVNVMVPSGADPHIYEPVPGQIAALSRSVAYISNGYLGFEITWLDRFYEANSKLKKLSLGTVIDLIKEDNDHTRGNIEGADPHFWVSPKSALVMAGSIKSLLCSMKPQNSQKYELNFSRLTDTIMALDKKANEMFSGYKGKSFMIFHPALGYIARDYGLIQIAVEKEGKEPSPSFMKYLIDIAKSGNIKVIFIQKGFDTKNAGEIASETGAALRPVDPLSEEWAKAVSDIIDAIHESLVKSGK